MGRLARRGKRGTQARERQHTFEQQARRQTQRDPAVAVRVLGPRPHGEDERKIWDRGAQAISGYRLAYQVTDRDTVLGAEPGPGGPGGFQQHRDWQQAAKLVLEARQRLGVDRDRGLGPDNQQARRWPGRTPPRPDRGIGFEL